MDDYKDFSEDERIFYLREAGFDSREKELFRLRVYEEKTLAEASEIMGYSTRTVDRINRKLLYTTTIWDTSKIQLTK